MNNPKPYHGEWESCDGLSHGEIRSTNPDGPWPAMVEIELDLGSTTMTTDDAKDLAAHIGAATSWSDFINRRRAAAENPA